ncbi:MAG: hypothetical protein JW786_09940, partial [Desulfobacterales bacterium]|nr:hypothetical protein [Desulfobacterales bacterium]
MSRHSFSYTVLWVVLAILVVLILSDAVFAQEQEPSSGSKEKSLSTIAAIAEITPPIQASPIVKMYIDVGK